MSESAYDDLGGGQHEDSYTVTGAINDPCPRDRGGCGALVGERCTFESEEYRPGLGVVPVTKVRGGPCVVRITGRKSNA